MLSSKLTPMLLVLLLGLALLAGCGTDATNVDTLAIVGTYTDEFGGDHQITASTWTSFGGSSVIHIIAYNNERQFLLGQNDAVHSFNPDQFARQDWTDFNGSLYYCSTVYNGATLDAAYAGQANASDPRTGGCDAVNNFPWTRLSP